MKAWKVTFTRPEEYSLHIVAETEEGALIGAKKMVARQMPTAGNFTAVEVDDDGMQLDAGIPTDAKFN